MKDNIQTLYKEIVDKKKAALALAEYWKMSPATIRNHWFSTFNIVPTEKQEKTLEILQNFRKIELENEVAD